MQLAFYSIPLIAILHLHTGCLGGMGLNVLVVACDMVLDDCVK